MDAAVIAPLAGLVFFSPLHSVSYLFRGRIFYWKEKCKLDAGRGGGGETDDKKPRGTRQGGVRRDRGRQ